MPYQILHIEDSKTDADLVKRQMLKSGMEFQYQLVSNRNEVEDALESFRPDVILCDHSLPSFDSKMAFNLCKHKNPDLTFILVTGTVSEDFAVEMLKTGVDDYLLKSNLFRLPIAIENAYSKRQTDKTVESLYASLMESETHLRTIFESSSTGLILLDRNHIILELNERTRYYNKISFGRELEKNDNLLEILPAYRRKEMQAKFDLALKGERVEYEAVYTGLNDSPVYFDVKLNPTIDDSGVITGVCITFDDISGRKRTEHALRESEIFNRSILKSIDYHIAVVEANGNILSVNEAWNDFSMKNGEFVMVRTAVGSNYIEVCEKAALTGDTVASEALKGFRKVLSKELGSFELEYPCHSVERQRWFLLRIVRFADDSPKVVMMHIDISQLKEAEAETKNLSKRLVMATKSAYMGIWDWDVKDDVLIFDDGMFQLYNLEKLKFGSVYNEWLSRLHPEDNARVNDEISDAISGKKSYDTEFRIIWDDESVHYIKATGSTERDSEGNVIRMTGLNWDITELKLTELRLKESNYSLQKQAKELAISNAELEQFAYVASHDLQEPLRMVTGFLTQLEKKYGDVIDKKGKTYIGFAVEGAKRMRQIILDLLDFSRVGLTDDAKEYVDLNEILREIKILFRKNIERKTATIDLDKLPCIYANRSPIYQLFQNLVGNALKYSQKDIPVRINISVKELPGCWEFAVSDNGIGIDEEYFEKIFIIFQRLHNKDEFSGTGMGLAITKKIVESQGGKIWVRSQVGKGSTFYFTLLKSA